MKVRQVVTGHDARGKSVVIADHAPAPVTVELMPGFETFELWSTDGDRTVPHQGSLPGVPSFFPGAQGTVLRMFRLPPERAAGEALAVDVGAAAMEVNAKLPGLLEHMEPERPGMHTTDSIDFNIVLEGEVDLELDDGVLVHLTAGCCVVQNGTRHAWRNRSGRSVLMASVLLGASRVGA